MASCRPRRMRFSEMVLRSLDVRMESMMSVYRALASGETIRGRVSRLLAGRDPG